MPVHHGCRTFKLGRAVVVPLRMDAGPHLASGRDVYPQGLRPRRCRFLDHVDTFGITESTIYSDSNANTLILFLLF